MSNLAREVAEELDKRAPNMSWLQKASLIVAANVFGLVLGAIVIAAGNMVWNKAMSTDAIKEEMARGDKVAEAERSAILEELASLGAEHAKFREMVLTLHAEDDGDPAPRRAYDEGVPPPNPWRDTPAPAPPELPEPIQAAVPETTAEDLRVARERIQDSIDKKVYRARQRAE